MSKCCLFPNVYQSYDDTSEFWRIKVEETDRNGYNSIRVFNRFGELVSETDQLGNTSTYTYDGNGNNTSITDPMENTVIFNYDDYNNLISTVDAEGKTTKFEYDSRCNLIKKINADNSFITNTYNSSNLITSTTDERGTTTYYDYDEKNNLISVTINGLSTNYTYENEQPKTMTDFNGNTSTYNYNAKKQLSSIVDALGNTTSYEYDENDNTTKITYADGKTESYEYDKIGNMLSHKDRNDVITTYVYDENNDLISEKTANDVISYEYDNEERLIKVTDCVGKEKTMTYDAAGRMISETDFNGNTFSYTFDAASKLKGITSGETTTHYDYYKTGKLHTSTDTYGNKTSYYYDNVWNVTKVTDPLGNSTLYEYDNGGKLTKVTTPLGNTNEYTYDFRGNVLSEKDGNGNITSYVYDDNGNMTKTVTADSKEMIYSYDELNRQVSITDFNGNVTKYNYDNVGNVSNIVLPTSQVYSYTYDGNGNVLTADEGNGIVKTTYDYNNNPIKAEDALGHTVSYTYDGNNNVLSYKTARGNIYKYTYDGNSNLTSETDPLGGVVSYNYNEFDTAVSFNDANDNKTYYTYDLLNRLAAETDANGNSDNYSYNGNSLLIEYTNKRNQTTSYTYDADSRLTGMTTVEGNTSYTYDSNSNLLTVTDENGTISRTYDELNRVTSYTDANGNTISYEYDSNSNLTKLIYPDDKIIRYSYNANNQLAKVQDWANRIIIYDYYENGNLKSESRPDGSIQTYTYNEIGQLTQTVDKAQDGTIINEYSYEYDADGNVITENSLYEPDYDNVTIPDAEMLYGNANQLTEFNDIEISYDNDGNMLNTPLGNKWGLLTYDSQNLLTDVITSDGAISFEYDAEGNRVSKTENGSVINYVVDANASLSQVLISEKDGKTTYYIYGLGLIAQENADGYKTYHYDYRGSTTAITDENGNITDRVYYDAYGSIISRAGTTDTPYLYAGQSGVETDSNGLYYMRARYYNPTIQRFVNVDPIKNGYNWYGYVSGNPVSSIDPTGYFDWSSKEQWEQFGNGVWDKMCEYSDNVWSAHEKIWSDPVKNLTILKDYAIQETGKTLKNGVKVVNAHLRGDINLFDIGAEYYQEQFSNAVAGVGDTFKSVKTGLWQLSPFSKVSNEDVYQLGYNFEGALLETSESVLTSYVGAKAPGMAKSIADKVSPKLKAAGNKIVRKVKGSIKTNKTPCGTLLGCFTEGTLIATEDGYKPIEEIEIGDYVWSENPYTGEVELKQVINTFIYEKDTLVILQVDGETIETTKEHPFYVESVGWVSAKHLEVGDVLRLIDGSNVKVDSIEIKELDNIINVYNFEVEDFHTYFVGEDSVLVHNSNSCIGTGYTKSGMKRATREWREQYGRGTSRKHHLIPQAMLKDKDFVNHMNKLGISDVKAYVDRQIAVIQNGLHIDLHSAGWNRDYKDWYKRNRNFTLQELRANTSKMMKDYNIPKSSRNFAKKY